MFPNSPGRPPLPHSGYSPSQLLQAQLSFQKHVGTKSSDDGIKVSDSVPAINGSCPAICLSRMLMNGNILPPMSPQPWSYGNHNPMVSPGSSSSTFQNRKRRSDEGNIYDVKRQRFHTPPQSSPAIHQSVPLRDDLRRSFPGSIALPLLQSPAPEINGCASSSRDSWLFDHVELTLPIAKEKLSQQILDLFQACQQQISDLKKKDVCRAELQREIQQIFPQSRLYLVGSSLNGFGTRSSDADLCLVMKEEPVNQKTEARHILSLLQKHFYTRLSYIERPQLIRAKVPIVKFRDKVSGVEFDLNVNNVVGIRNTFLLRTYAHMENRVRPLVLVVKKWASHHGINDASRGTLSSYSLVLMVLHYLQTQPEPILPSLQKIYPDCFNPTMQLHLVHQAPRNVPQYFSKNGASLGELLVGFLKYFAIEFEWGKRTVSVREGKAMARTDGIEWRNKYICVEEPFDRTNTARAVHEKQKFDLIQEEFLKAWVRLRDNRDLNSVLPVQRIIGMQKR
ncbi:poly(A) RNA polymerase GLD2 isoform X1 [Pelobates fuscus]|uniref:poly(A) RNA polymerase GLD2 isoform X1 n=1 Tax=Pelobates fuscus TaxID=191477 RepID=UPI002FE48673